MPKKKPTILERCRRNAELRTKLKAAEPKTTDRLGEIVTRCGHYEEARNFRCPDAAIWELELFVGDVVRACDVHTDALKRLKQVKRRRLLSLMSNTPLTS